uniref:Uncharacterized protein n=1 Tax=Candidatus Kentrum sp. FM TaxID=2126340 RepID=A0A450U1J7_9GAMM|nr:MAG: hypothetical protein BECKFM1743A_GA0114220_109231 [Candidatus Kentron sp. FM]VFJ76788.1 MAG: hypothetical protein BECKFM1743C_GA0114222_109472 [Candidatus Kentron sp. FM]VFK21968.1 MAG: hypothetical protein BECKFM1743B_GA0114221_108301 [Candidatus Kentron sp. FM]
MTSYRSSNRRTSRAILLSIHFRFLVLLSVVFLFFLHVFYRSLANISDFFLFSVRLKRLCGYQFFVWCLGKED